MRKLTVGLLAVGLLAVAAPAMAQTSDPMGLIASGAVLPFIGEGLASGGAQSFIEIYSPVGDNSGEDSGGIGGVHMFFHDVTCKRVGDSVGLPVTANGVAILRVDNLIAGLTKGLITLAAVDQTGFALIPLGSPIHADVVWVNATGDVNRILEPISLNNAEAPQNALNPSSVWNPLRSGATFFALPELASGGSFTTEIDLICPTVELTADFPSPPFPALIPAPVAAQQKTKIGLRIYDLTEDFVRNTVTACDCFTTFATLGAIDAAYDTDVRLTSGSYTELESSTASPNVCLPGFTSCSSFTGYRGIKVSASATPGNATGLDIFGRLHNGNRLTLGGIFNTAR